VTTPVDMLQYTNSLTENLYGIFVLTGLFMIVFLSQKNYPTPQAFASASFTTAIASYLLFIIGLVPVGAVLTTTIMVLTSVFFLYQTEGQRR